jgi:hypothetical protein
VQCYRGGFLFGVNVVNNALLFTYLLVAASVISFPWRAPSLYRGVAFIRSRAAQVAIALGSMATVGALLVIRVRDDVLAYRSGEALVNVPSASWLLALAAGAAIFLITSHIQKAMGRDLGRVFATLPDESQETEGPQVD